MGVAVNIAFLPPEKAFLLSQVRPFSPTVSDDLLPGKAIDYADEDSNLNLRL